MVYKVESEYQEDLIVAKTPALGFSFNSNLQLMLHLVSCEEINSRRWGFKVSTSYDVRWFDNKYL